jgi:hypothetical protein
MCCQALASFWRASFYHQEWSRRFGCNEHGFIRKATGHRAISKLAFFPFLGSVPKDSRLIHLKYRMPFVDNYLVFYAILDEVVEIRRIIQQNVNMTSLFSPKNLMAHNGSRVPKVCALTIMFSKILRTRRYVMLPSQN